MPVEMKVGLVTLLVLGAVALGLVAGEPEPIVPLEAAASAELLELEDTFAGRRDDLGLATRLAAEYLRLHQPALAVGVVGQVAPELAADPMLTHRLAQGYEGLGRLHDAIATAHLARLRCERAVGSARAPERPVAAHFACTPGALVALEQHEDALVQMLRWGVEDPRSDGRARMAHRLAARRARIASAQLW